MFKKIATIFGVVVAALMAVGVGSAAIGPSSDSTITTTSSTTLPDPGVNETIVYEVGDAGTVIADELRGLGAMSKGEKVVGMVVVDSDESDILALTGDPVEGADHRPSREDAKGEGPEQAGITMDAVDEDEVGLAGSQNSLGLGRRGDQADGAATDVHALVKLLGNAHGALRGEAQLT